MKERISGFAQALVENNTDKQSFSARFKKSVGENLLSFKDRQFRNGVYRMTGSMGLFLAGVEFMDKPGAAPKIVGAVLGNIAVADNVMSSLRVVRRYNELQDNQSESTPAQAG
jgi:hypothetical protein